MQQKFSIETERAVIEHLMRIGDYKHMQAQKAMLELESSCFYDMQNKIIFHLIQDCCKKQASFTFTDILILIPKTNNETYLAVVAIMHDYSSVPLSDARFKSYIEALVIFAKLRSQMQIANNMLQELGKCQSAADSQEIIANSVTEISSLTYRVSKQGITNEELTNDFLQGDIADDLRIPTDSKYLNSLLEGGIVPKSLIVIAAGASVGKTGFSIFLTDLIARAQPNTQSLFFSIEMEAKHIWMRHVGICGGKPFNQLSHPERISAISRASIVPMTIYDTTMSRNVSDIDFIVTASRLKAMEKPISVIVVDYLGLVNAKGNHERNDLKQAYITSQLAQLAIELNCTVIALSQINRGNAQRSSDDRCPWPHDAADSSGGHRSASLWIGVDRPTLYMSEPEYRNQFVMKCRKNRFGNIFETILAFNGGTFAFMPYGTFQSPKDSYESNEEEPFSMV